MSELSKRQLAALEHVWCDLQNEPGAALAPDDNDAACRAALDAWLAGTLSSKGRLSDGSLDALIELEREAENQPVAQAYVARVVGTVMPGRNGEPPLCAELASALRDHSRRRDYQLSGPIHDRYGYCNWEIDVPVHAGSVRLSFNGEVVLLTFPGGYTWPAFAQQPEDAIEALADQLRLLDSYAHPATRTVQVKRAFRRPRTELRLSDGTVLCRRGGMRSQT
jgi:hypothetical protein